MKEDLTSIFDANRVQLTKQIDTDGPLLNRLLQDKVLLDEHYEEIKAKETKQRKIETLLDILKRRDDMHYKLFWETLAEYQPALVKECLNPVIADPGTPTSPLSTSEILRLQRHASNTSKENDSLILENELLKIKKEKSDLELQVQQLEAELTSAREVNEAHELKEKQMGTDLEMLRRKSAAVFYELQNSRKQCACLTDQVQKMKEDFGQLEVRLCKTEERKREADDIINNQTEEMSSMRDNILELEMKLDEYEDTHPKTLDNIHQLGDDVRVEGGSAVMGVTWMDERIYVVCLNKNKIFVFLDQAPFQQQNSEQIELKDMKNPRDIVAISKDKCLFIGDKCDRDQRLWKIQMPERMVSKWPINRKPEKLSKTCSDELLVLVSNRLNDDEDEYFIYIYKLDSPTPIRQIILPSDCINEALHAVQISQGMFLISHKVEIMEAGQRRSAWLVSKMNMNGNVIRQFKPALVEAVSLSRPEYFQVGEKGSIIAVDQNNDRVVIINANLTCGQVLIRHDSQHTTFKKPFRICHLTDKNIYIVGHWTQRGGTFSVYGQQN